MFQISAQTTLPGSVYPGSKLRPHWEFQLYPPRGYGFESSLTREMGHGVRIISANLPIFVHCARVPILVQLVKKGPMKVLKVWEEVVLSVAGWSSKMDIGPIT